MQGRFLVPIALLSIAATTTNLSAASSALLRPSGKPEILRLRVGGGLSTYFVATADRPLAFRVHGPVAIRLLSRLLYEGEPGTGPIPYRVRLEIDGVELRTLAEAAGRSAQARIDGGGPVGALKKRIVQIPSGKHKLHVYPLDEEQSVAFRVLRGTGKPKKINWISFAPETYERAVRLDARDLEYTYYRFGGAKPVSLSIIGPLHMKIMTRLDFGLERGYSQAYAVKTFLDGELHETTRLKSRPSYTSTYPELPEITPGVARDVFLDVPSGDHEIRFELDCTTAQNASLRLLIPETAVTNGR